MNIQKLVLLLLVVLVFFFSSCLDSRDDIVNEISERFSDNRIEFVSMINLMETLSIKDTNVSALSKRQTNDISINRKPPSILWTDYENAESLKASNSGVDSLIYSIRSD
jgi:hypothetical protein